MSDTPNQATPQDTACGFRAAMIAGNFDEAFAHMTVELQNHLVAGAIVGAAYTSSPYPEARQKLVDVCETHGVRKDSTLNKETHELVSIFRGLLDWSDQYMPADQKLDLAAKLGEAEYSEFRVQEDRAYAISTVDGKRVSTRFRRIDDRWYIA